MTPEVLAALRRSVAELGADAGVLLRLTGSGACVVVSSTLGPALGVHDLWGPAGLLSGPDPRPELVTDPVRLPQLVPAGVLGALAVEPSAALVAPVGDSPLRMVLLWSQTSAPDDVASAMQSEAVRQFAAVAPLAVSPGSIIGTMRDAQAEVEYREEMAASERQARSLVDAYEAARDEAVRASTAKTAFLSRMSHELRTPLNAVLGFAQLLALDPLTPEQAEAVHHIRTGGRHLLDLINEIVDISRIEAGRLSLSMETVDSAAVLAEAVELVRPLQQQYGVLVAACGGRAVPAVHADRQRTTQVLLNLVSNAVKYNRPGGSVRVECRAGGPGEVLFEVSDTGPGIPQELLSRLFEPFDRLGAENSDVEGTGIGLALAEALARAMGGRIEVSTTLGRGSTFTLVLRAAPPDAAHAGTVPPEPEAHPDSRLRILYVEDNPTNATLMARVVALRPGSRLQVAVDGAHGIAAALLEPPDLVFLDLHLPDIPGEEVLQQLRPLPGLAEVPVVVVTADASPSARERMSVLGADGFLTKPLDLDDVLGWIDATASGVRVP